MFDNINRKSLIGCGMSIGSIDELCSLGAFASGFVVTRPITYRAVSVQSRYSAGGQSQQAGVRSHSKLHRQLSAAVSEEDPQLLRQLLSNGVDPSSFAAYPDLLHCACATGNLANVALLLRYGANVNSLVPIDR